MGETLSFYAVKKDSLDKLPVGFKKLVTKWFEDSEIFGEPYLVLLDSDFKTIWNEISEEESKEFLEGIDKKYDFVMEWVDDNKDLVYFYWWG